MIRRLFLTLTIALLFGLGQQGALLHAIEHVSEQQGSHEKHVGSSVCDKCVAYAALFGAVSGTAIFTPAVTQAVASFSTVRLTAASRIALPYAARAPPIFV